ncbi:hypothetical protein LJC09_00835 [Desulfovibrio sp. OttesenSCG-928-F20]|nr:hypothetical protein [Desulfovibrio sp. OttesenSCG-928-F20]
MINTDQNVVENPKYIYLDWNSFACARDSHHEYHSMLLRTISIYKEKGFYFPFSEGHIRDLFTKLEFVENEHTEKNFGAITCISNNWCLAMRSDTENDYLLVKKYPREVFMHIKDADPKSDSLTSQFILSKEPYSSLREPYVKDFEQLMSRLANNGNIEAAACVQKLASETLEELESRYREAIKFIYNINNSGDFSEEYFIQNGFRFLDFTKIFKEKLTHKNLPANIMNDGTHALFSRQAIYFVSEDADFREKYRFLKKISDLNAQIMSIKDFCSLDLNSTNTIPAIALESSSIKKRGKNK